MKKYLHLVILFLCFQLAHSQENKSFAKGYEYYLSGDFSTATQYFEAAIKEDPKMGDAYYFKGLVLARQGQFTQALPLFNKAININQLDGAYYGDRGVVYAQLGRNKEALKDFEFAAKYDSLNPARHFNLAAYYLNQGNCATAIKYLNNCLEVDPDHLTARFKRAICFIKMNTREKAIADLSYVINNFVDQSTSLNPTDDKFLLGSAYLMRGGIYGEAGEFSKSVNDLKKAASYITDDAEIYNSLGYYMIFTSEIGSSIEFLDKSIEMEPTYRNYNSRAFAYYKMGKLELAEKDALQSKSLNTSNPESYYNLALIYKQMGRSSESCAAKKTAEKLGLERKKVLEIGECR